MFFVSENVKNRMSKMIVIFGIMALIPIMLISFYNHPSADDYNYSEVYVAHAVQTGEGVVGVLGAAFKTMEYFQNVWQGTYSAAFLNSVQPGIWGSQEEFYALTAYILLGSILLGVYCLTKQLFNATGHSTKYTFTISFLITLTIVEGFPVPVQGLFWYCGAMTYIFFWALMLVQTALFLSYNCSPKKKVVKILFGIWNAFFIAGGNHITSFTTILIGVGFVIFSIICKKYKNTVVYFLWTFVSIMGFIIVMAAPGTAIRAGVLERQSVIKTLIVSVYTTVVDFVHYTNLPLVCLLLIILLLTSKKFINENNLRYFKFRYSLLMTILSFGLYCVSVCVPFYAMGFAGAGRVDNMRYALFVVLTVINYYYFTFCIAAYIHTNELLKSALDNLKNVIEKGISLKCIHVFVYAFTILATVCILLFNGRVSISINCFTELISGEAQKYDEIRDQHSGTDVNNIEYTPDMIYYSSFESG